MNTEQWYNIDILTRTFYYLLYYQQRIKYDMKSIQTNWILLSIYQSLQRQKSQTCFYLLLKLAKSLSTLRKSNRTRKRIGR